MSEIPSDIASSAAQAALQAREVARERAGSAAGQGNAAQRQVKAVDEAGSTVETEDADNQVFTDAEGSGSQGKPFEDDRPAEEAEATESEDGVIRGEDGRLHLDLEA